MILPGVMCLSLSAAPGKLLFWEHGGFVIYYKRMDNGSFEVPPLRADGQGGHISEIQLLQVLRGIEF